MLKVKHNGNNIEIRFYNEILESFKIEGLTGRDFDENRKCYLATISINGVHVSQGISVCHPKDNFCKAIGRKKALAHALFNNFDPHQYHSMTHFTKEVRTAIWQEYKSQCKI